MMPTPPRWSQRLLTWFCKPELVEHILGDLEESFTDDVGARGLRRARFRYSWEVLRMMRPSLVKSLNVLPSFSLNGSLVKNYLKVSLRSLLKQKLSTTINILGLSIGIACASLAFLFTKHELSFDKFHRDHEQIYWLTASIQQQINLSSTPGPLAPELEVAFPEVTEACRFQDAEVLVHSKGEYFNENGLFADTNFFTFFDFPLKVGDLTKVLEQPKSLILSQEMATKYFDHTDPIGQILSIAINGVKESFTVAGIVADAPTNSSIRYNLIFPIQSLNNNGTEGLDSDWGSFPVTSFIRVKDRSALGGLKRKMPAFINSKYPDNSEEDEEPQFSFALHALDDYHLNDGFKANGLIDPANMSYVRILGLIAGLILLVACINFINLSNAQSSRRLSEVSVRRVMGARDTQVIAPILTESVMVSGMALAFAIFLIGFSQPLFSQLLGYPLEIDWLQPSVFLSLLAIALFTGLLAGIYPAILMSRLKVVNTFKSAFKIGGNNFVTKGSLIFQFALSIGLLSCTFIMYQQQRFIANQNLGFDKEEILVIDTQLSYEERRKSASLVTRFKSHAQEKLDIVSLCAVSNSFNKGNRAQFIQEEDGTHNTVYEYQVDNDYIPLLGLNVLRGRNFSEDFASADKKSIIVNETFVRQFELSDDIGYRLPEKFGDMAGSEIIGVVKDYHYQSLRTRIRPMALVMNDESYFQNILVKIKPNDVSSTIAHLKKLWLQVQPDKPFEFSFMDEDIQRAYVEEERWNKAISHSAVLAIVIACLGLFGLVALTLSERTKEIGIRKILGASIRDITWLISGQFIALVVIASVVAIPIALIAMQRWLQNFAYQAGIEWAVFFVAVLITLGITFVTAGAQAVVAATENPANSVKNE